MKCFIFNQKRRYRPFGNEECTLSGVFLYISWKFYNFYWKITNYETSLTDATHVK